MDFDKYQKLEKKIKKQSFANSYKAINTWATLFSLLGNCASIFFAYFLLFSILKESMPSVKNTMVISAITVLFLIMFEMLKRYVFNKFSLEHIRAKFKVFKTEVLILTLFSVLMIAGSFYLSLNGAQKFTDQLEHIVEQNDSQYLVYQDSVTKIYDDKIKIYDDKNSALIQSNDVLTEQNIVINKEAENINSNSTKKAKYKLIEQNNLRIDKNNEKIDKNDLKISELEEVRDVNLAEKKKELEEDAIYQIDKGETNSVKFVILSTFIELIILIGIYFNSFYEYKSFSEYEEHTKSDPNFNKWLNYDKLLEIIYDNGTSITRVGEDIISTSKIIDIAKINNYLKLDKNMISDGFKIFNHLGIINTRGSKRTIEVDFEISKEVLKDYFKIK